jgi:acetyl-CoA synthetase
MREIIHEPDDDFVEATNIYDFLATNGFESYEDAHAESIANQSWFWEQVIEETGVQLFTPFDRVVDDEAPIEHRGWFEGATYNLAHDAVDKHVSDKNGDDVAILWENEREAVREISYRELSEESNRVANALRTRGVEAGDRVLVYVPNVPEAVAILYGSLKLGAIPVPLFSGYGRDAIAKRIESASPTVAIVGDSYRHGGATVSQKATFDEATTASDSVESVIVLDYLGTDVDMQRGRDVYWSESVATASPQFEAAELPADATAMILYTSGTTGRPKGTVHTHLGLGTKFAKDLYFDFDFRPEDRLFWVTDLGWIMGPWSIIGSHILGGTVVLYSGAIGAPDIDHLWRMVERHAITTLGVSPTAVRGFRESASRPVEAFDLGSLRLLGSTGEPWDEANWRWFYDHVGGAELPIINVSGGTEAGGHFLAPSPIQPLKPCTVGGPTLGVDADIVDERGRSIREHNREGYLVLRNSLPSLTRGFWENERRYLDTFWNRWDGLWDHGDWAQMDADGFWYLHGRADDVVNVSGRKIAPMEIEEILNRHGAVKESAVVGESDDGGSTRLVAFVVLYDGVADADGLEAELIRRVGKELGKPFRPGTVRIVHELPKTHSGKLNRRKLDTTKK